ncbi:hypothetical protein, partial [Escherichia coli]|uniref:hypothetical protein n=1 Tax=Escherichia coli TaxID=562 RepID=UPI0033635F9B
VTVITAGWPQLLPESDLLRIIRPAPEAFARLKPVSEQKSSTAYKKQSHHPPSGAYGPSCF